MSKKKKTETPVVVENPDNLPSALFDDAKIDIKGLIRVIRGQQVMLDFDLAMLYGEKTKRLNEQVKRNINRFPDDFMFQLDNKEWNVLRSQIATTEVIEDEYVTLLRSQFATAKDLSKIRTLPYAFTRNGIGMLSSVLGSKTAVAMNAVMRTLVLIMPFRCLFI